MVWLQGETLLELGRYRQHEVQRSERICPVCNVHEVEDELHFIFRYPEMPIRRAQRRLDMVDFSNQNGWGHTN